MAIKLSIIGVCFGVLFPMAVSAHSDLSSCGFDISYNIQIEKNDIHFKDHDKSVMRIVDNDELYIHGKQVKLNSEQERLVEELANGYRELLPGIATVAAEAAEIGIKAAAMTLNALFVDDTEFNEKIMTRLDGISEKLKQHINDKNFNGEYIEDGKFDSAFEKDIEEIVEESIGKASGKFALTVLSQIFSGDEEELNDMEFRMEMFGKEMEEVIEKQAEALGIEAEKLCDVMKKIDKVETRLQEELDVFSSIDIIQKD